MLNDYLKLIWTYLKIGLFGFGGGYAMLSLIQREVVDSGWISSQMFTDIVAISQMTPGPIGINSATYIGYVVTGILTLIAAHYIERHRQSVFIKGAFMGLRPVVVGLIASAALLLMNSENFGYEVGERMITIAICVASFCVVYFTRVHPILVIILAGIIGLLVF